MAAPVGERSGLLAHAAAPYDEVLAKDDSAFVRVTNGRVIGGERTQGSLALRISRRGVIGLILLLNGVAQSTIYKMSLDLAGKDKALGYTLGTADLIDFTTLESWAILSVVKEQLNSLSPDEDLLLRPQMHIAAKIVTMAVSLGLACSLQVPFAMEVSNHQSWIVMKGISLGAVSFEAGCVTMNSVHSTLERLITYKNRSPTNKKLQIFRHSMIGRTEENLEAFVGMDCAGQRGKVRAFQDIKAMAGDFERYQAFMKMMLQEFVPGEVHEKTWGERLYKGVDKGVGGLAALTFIAFEGMLGYLMGNALSGKPLGVVLAIVAAGANTYLSGTAIPPTVHRVFKGIRDIVTGQYQKSLGEQLSPKLSYSLKVISGLLACLCWGPAAQATKDGIPEPYTLPAQIAVAGSFIFLVSTALQDVIDGLILKIARARGTPEEKELLEFYNTMIELKSLITKAPIPEFAKGVAALPQETFDDFAHSSGLSIQDSSV